jgi:hypothetical protein
MVHTYKGKNLEFIRTTWLKNKDWDIYKLPDGKILGMVNGKPTRIWNNMKDFQWTSSWMNM